jgi:hypothetical protein
MRVFVLLGGLLLATHAAAQEKFVMSDASVRTLLYYKAPSAAVQKMLPDGWEVDSPSSGPSAGANLRIVFIETVWSETAQGKSLPPGRPIVISVPAKKKGAEDRGEMVIGGLSNGPGPYGVYAHASTTSQRTLLTDTHDAATIEESWNSKADNGDAIELQLQYVRGVAATSKTEVRDYSAAKLGFYRIYRYTQAADVLRGVGASSERLKAFTFKATGPTLGPLFDGTEQIVSITAQPYYSRQIFLPGP